MSQQIYDITSVADVRMRIDEAVREDVGTGDATTLALVPPALCVEAEILSRQPCVVSGMDVAAYVFRSLQANIIMNTLRQDGEPASAGEVLMRLSGQACAILSGERTALNFMQRMCGIATLTAAFADAVRPFGTMILDTRKTSPGLRVFEKYAVLCGGGTNHRIGLFDRILVKDNHRRLWKGTGNRNLGAAVREARRHYPDLEVEIEVENEMELNDALQGAPEWVLLDNMPSCQMARCVSLAAGKCKTEASGGITLDNVVDVARSGVDAISLGCLTHSVPAIDLSLEIC